MIILKTKEYLKTITGFEYSKKLKNKKFHRLEALRVAVQTQIIIDEVEFRETRIHRCWDCSFALFDELKKLNKETGISQESSDRYIKGRIEALCKERGIK